MIRLAMLFASLCASAALAAPPPGHPSPAEASDMLMPDKPPAAADLPNLGKVLSSIDANDFSYIEVARDGSTEWIAAPRMQIRPGARIRYEQGAVMVNFYSKLLLRSFPSVMFVGHVMVVDP